MNRTMPQRLPLFILHPSSFFPFIAGLILCEIDTGDVQLML